MLRPGRAAARLPRPSGAWGVVVGVGRGAVERGGRSSRVWCACVTTACALFGCSAQDGAPPGSRRRHGSSMRPTRTRRRRPPSRAPRSRRQTGQTTDTVDTGQGPREGRRGSAFRPGSPRAARGQRDRGEETGARRQGPGPGPARGPSRSGLEVRDGATPRWAARATPRCTPDAGGPRIGGGARGAHGDGTRDGGCLPTHPGHGQRSRTRRRHRGVGVHADRVSLGTQFSASRCRSPLERYSVSGGQDVSFCFRAVHRRVEESVRVHWLKDGRLVRRSTLPIPPIHAYRTRARSPCAASTSGAGGRWR